MSTLTNFIIKGAIASVAGVLIGEAVIVGIQTVKIRKEHIKSLQECADVSKETIDDAKKSKDVWLASLKAAAKMRVEHIKKDPIEELCALWGCATYMFGLWKGSNSGFFEGWSLGGNGVDTVITTMQKYAPKEFNMMLDKIKKTGPDKVLLSNIIYKNELKSAYWVPSACELAEVVDTVAKEVAS